MKTKLAVIVVVLVALMLPAVAAAHTMSYGYNGGNSFWGWSWYKSVNPTVKVQPGPNYASAEKVGAISWNYADKWSYYSKYCPSGSSSGGTLDLEGISDMSTTMLNVIDVNVTNPGYKTIKYINFEVGVIGDFPHGTAFVISKDVVDFSSGNISWTPFSHTAYNNVTFHFNLNSYQTKTFYIGFYLPPSSEYSSSNGNLWYQLTVG